MCFPVDLCEQAKGLAFVIVLRSLFTHCHSNRNSPNNSSELLMLTQTLSERHCRSCSKRHLDFLFR